MSAFDFLEKRILDMSLSGVADQPERTVVVGLFKSQPAESHDGTYGQSGEPLRGASGYKRAVVQFPPTATGAVVNGTASGLPNSAAVTLTGLAPGVYTHFAIFGSSSAGQ